MPCVKCAICKTGFYAKPFLLNHGWGKYCSRACQFKGQMKGKIVQCFTCGGCVYKGPRALRNSKSGKFFCNKSCQTIWRNSVVNIGENHSSWKDGNASYRKVLKRTGVVRACVSCDKDDKRILQVHHKDHNRSNNSVKNLVWLCLNCHHLVHRHPGTVKL